jgi:hypothetical protein
MDVLFLLLFIGVVLVTGAILLFAISVRNGDYNHAEEISLLPLKEDDNAK